MYSWSPTRMGGPSVSMTRKAASRSVDLSEDTTDADRVATSSEVRQLRLALLTEPDYLEFHCSRALAENARDVGPSGESIER